MNGPQWRRRCLVTAKCKLRVQGRQVVELDDSILRKELVQIVGKRLYPVRTIYQGQCQRGSILRFRAV
jgi:hypothetical protein